ncbi:MAG: methylmalonyl-CoA mutase small subunit [Prevotella sp.]|jgi:methylmalonyl-CoA mutase|nr:methylmalonyl-CoA mutase small subunit [Prevotella sp.]
MDNNSNKLFQEFVAPTAQEWIDKIQVDLKGADFQKRMVWRTNEGFDVQPFYRREDVEKLQTPDSLPGEFPFVRGNKKLDNEWYVRQNITANSAAEANAKALDVLNKGVTSLGFSIPKAELSEEYIDALLNNIVCDCVELNFVTCKRCSLKLAEILVAYFEKKGYDKENIVASIDWDPIEKTVAKGKDVDFLFEYAPKLIETVKDYPNFRVISVNSVSLCNSGAYIVQELGYALAWGAEYLQQLVDAGVEPTLAAKKIKFNMGVSENYFMEIAKFRAARMLWAEIVKQYEPKCECACKMIVNAETSMYNMTVFDAYVNMLRTQTESMSAALAGVHSIVVNPFDAAYEEPNDFSERIARNQQLLLKEECHFSTVVDPSAGSYYIEELTSSLAKEAWKLFIAVEEQGGFFAAAKAGTIQDAINSTNEKRHLHAAQRKEFILGTNQFPNFTENSEGKVAETECCNCGCDETAPFKSICASRLSADFESLRLSTEKADKQPVAFMLTVGNLVWRQARAQFSTNFLACAGYKVIDNLGFSTVEEGIDAALAANADIVVICSSDEEYAEYAIPAYKYLDNRAIFVVAGAPACAEELKEAGIENFIHVKVNQLETLKAFNEKLGI